MELVVVPDPMAHQRLLLETICEVCKLNGSIKFVLLEQLADMLVKHNNPPRMMGLQQTREMQKHQEQMQRAQQNASSQ